MLRALANDPKTGRPTVIVGLGHDDIAALANHEPALIDVGRLMAEALISMPAGEQDRVKNMPMSELRIIVLAGRNEDEIRQHLREY